MFEYDADHLHVVTFVARCQHEHDPNFDNLEITIVMLNRHHHHYLVDDRCCRRVAIVSMLARMLVEVIAIRVDVQLNIWMPSNDCQNVCVTHFGESNIRQMKHDRSGVCSRMNVFRLIRLSRYTNNSEMKWEYVRNTSTISRLDVSTINWRTTSRRDERTLSRCYVCTRTYISNMISESEIKFSLSVSFYAHVSPN